MTSRLCHGTARPKPAALLRDPPIAVFVTELCRSRRGGPRVLIDLDDDPTGHADIAWLRSLTGTDPELAIVQTPGSRHAIASWAERVVPALTTLFASQSPD